MKIINDSSKVIGFVLFVLRTYYTNKTLTNDAVDVTVVPSTFTTGDIDVLFKGEVAIRVSSYDLQCLKENRSRWLEHVPANSNLLIENYLNAYVSMHLIMSNPTATASLLNGDRDKARAEADMVGDALSGLSETYGNGSEEYFNAYELFMALCEVPNWITEQNGGSPRYVYCYGDAKRIKFTLSELSKVTGESNEQLRG